MTKNDNKIFWGIIIISILIGIFVVFKIILIKKNPMYIFGKITRKKNAKQTSIEYEFIYENKIYNGSMAASGLGVGIGDYFLIQFQKTNPNNFRPIFNKESWLCVLKDSAYYYGSSKKPDCEY